jgi:AraC-like DNA-binding protein
MAIAIGNTHLAFRCNMAQLAVSPTVSAGFAHAFVEFAVGRGAQRAKLLSAGGPGLAELDDPDARVPLGAFQALVTAGKTLTGNPALPLEFGAATDLRHFSIAGLIAHNAATMAEALVQLNRYGRLVADVEGVGDGPRFEIRMENGQRWMLDRRANPNAFPELTESTWSRFICFTRHAFPHLTYALAAQVTHAAPAHAEAYERLWRVPVAFAADRNAIQTTLDFDDAIIAPDNRYVFGVLAQRGDALLEELQRQTTLRGQIEALILPRLHTGAVSVEQIAALMETSRQTLYRGLKAEGVTFAEVLDELRCRMAHQYLEGRKASVNETAYLVGFSDASTFSRAFKRWTGHAPSRAMDRGVERKKRP